MKILLKLVNISYETKDFVIFTNANGMVQQGERIGIIGKNGAGKSTLLQIIKGDLPPSNGHIRWMETDLIAVLVVQETEIYDFGEATPEEKKLLEKFKVPKHDFSRLSGGEKLKARLAKGLAATPGLLLLDEPTNHLDEQSTELLIDLINDYDGTILFVSHDRYFLDRIATKIWSFESKEMIEHSGNYSSYLSFRKKKRLSQKREYEKQQKMIAQIEEQMENLTSWSKKAHAQSTKQEGYKEYYRAKAKRMDIQVKSKRKRLEKELAKRKVEQPDEEYTVDFSLERNHKLGKRFLEVKNLTKSFGSQILFKNAHFTVQHGEKVALTGPNGSGKSTLLKIISGQEEAEGEIWISPSANIGFLTQEVFDLPLEKTPQQMFYRETYKERGKVQNLMKHLGFTSSQWTEQIKHMSMGERVKIKLTAFILEEKDVLVLDEPTNHLDLPSREQLESTLEKYTGTLLIVSHDRYFIEKTTDCKLIITNGTIQKQLTDRPMETNKKEILLKLETERQEVLGKLSFIDKSDQAYAVLDQKFQELTQQINQLK